MTKEQQRIAIATACGWKKGNDKIRDWWIPPKPNASWVLELPDYPNSLDAMAEAEKVLETMGIGGSSNPADHPFMRYCWELGRLTMKRWFVNGEYHGNPHDVWPLLHATAAQRAESFLRCLNLWPDAAPDGGGR